MSWSGFDIFGELMHWGNRQDREIDADEWYSWEAHVSDDDDAEYNRDGHAYVTVSSEHFDTEQYLLEWHKCL